MKFTKESQAIISSWMAADRIAEVEILNASEGGEVGIDDITSVADFATHKMLFEETAKDAEEVLGEIAANFDVYINDGNSTEVHHSGDYVTLSELDGKAVTKMESGELYTAVTH